MSATARVCISGAGLHHRLGGLPEVREAVAAGRTAVEPWRAAEGMPELPGAPSAEAASPAPYLPGPRRKLLKYLSPTSAMAVLAAGRALEAAGLLGDEQGLAHTALYVATDLIAFDLAAVSRAVDAAKDDAGELDLSRLGGQGLRLCHPLMPFKMLLNMPLGAISVVFGLRGENQIVYPGAVQAGVLLEAALRGLRCGRLSRVLWGGTAHRLDLLPASTRLRAGDHRPAADAAAFLVLECEEQARARGLAPLAVVREARPTRGGDTPVDRWYGSGLPAAEAEATVELDPLLGHAGAAALPLALALAGDWLGESGQGRAGAVVGDGDGGRASALLEAAS